MCIMIYTRLPVMQRKTGLVCKLLFANLAEVFLFARMSGLMINQIRFCLETGIARLTNVWSIIGMH